MNYNALGKRIRDHRRALGLTQEQLAEKTGVSISFIGHIERGSRKASLDTLVAICNAMNMSPAVLLQDSLICDLPVVPEETSRRQRDLINEISRVILENYDR
ncbi:MAG: helix-turn-helix transcriptional regulator [Clostridia bacterium]|nr:helix-turn-helix transcriptional regulator [Clostridia bacterium]MBQ4619693.1 helix-turn-helix transcriptional regulator [Clostridia bacterium]